jgi:hypothetical protein
VAGADTYTTSGQLLFGPGALGNYFLKVLSIVRLYSTYVRAMTFESLCQCVKATCSHVGFCTLCLVEAHIRGALSQDDSSPLAPDTLVHNLHRMPGVCLCVCVSLCVRACMNIYEYI